ncbi:MAG: FxsA family protein, partial [Rhodobacteraceae bacterium]|nr:FxsA family protein [Paracoccaceae bacterium]
MWLFLAFVGIPLIEIALFIQIGGALGLAPTLIIVILTAVLGTFLVRNQGRIALGNLQRSFSELNDPTEPLAHGAMILISGALLLTPGFFTDAIGFSLLLPPVREAVYRFLRKRVQVQSFSMGSTHRAEPYRSGPD